MTENLKGQLTELFAQMSKWRDDLERRGLFHGERNRVRAGSMFLAEALRLVNVKETTEKVRAVSIWLAGTKGLRLRHDAQRTLQPRK